MKTFSIAILVMITSINISCSHANKISKTPTPLYGTKWALKKIHTNGGSEDVTTKAFLRFDKEKSSAGGNGSCNTFGSTVTIQNDQVSFKNIFSTKMFCEGVQDIENKFFNELAKATRYVIDGESLILYSGNDVILSFIAE